MTHFPGQVAIASRPIADVAEAGEEGIILPAPEELSQFGVEWFCLFLWGWVPVTSNSLMFTDKNSGSSRPEDAIDYLRKREEKSTGLMVD